MDFDPPLAVRVATDAYLEDEDTFAGWMAEHCEIERTNDWKRASSAALFADWTGYAKAAGEEAGTRKSFAERMRRKGFEPHKGTGGVREYLGIRIKPPTVRWDASDG